VREQVVQRLEHALVPRDVEAHQQLDLFRAAAALELLCRPPRMGLGSCPELKGDLASCTAKVWMLHLFWGLHVRWNNVVPGSMRRLR
jgi:hypothetical protein